VVAALMPRWGSDYTYAEATVTQSLPDWIGAHVRALAFMGGVPAQLVPDNPKVGVDRANWYEPGLNRTYLDLATHYGTAILPTRPLKPRDKAKVEVADLARRDRRAAGDLVVLS
jgi:transposase